MTDALLIAAEKGVGALAHLQRPGGYLVHLLLRGEPTEGIIDTKFSFQGRKNVLNEDVNINHKAKWDQLSQESSRKEENPVYKP